MNIEVKLEYKLTDIGVIPEDWSLMPLHELTTEIGDGIHSTPIYSRNSEYYFINGNNLQNGKVFISESTKSVNYLEFKKHRKNLGDKSILMSINGTIGNLGLFSGEQIILGKSAAYLNLKRDVSRSFVYYALQSDWVKAQFSDGLTGTTIKNLGLGTIRDTGIPLPASLSEQHDIAAALSDMDALISGLEQIISKKRGIKQATIQNLLTGQQRLPGFIEEWEIKRLGDVFTISTGQSKSAYIRDYGDYWIVDMGSVSIDGKLIVSKATNFIGDFLNVGDLVMPKDDIGGGGIIGRAAYIDADNTYVLSDHLYRLKANFGNPLFLSYAINAYHINSALRKKVIGSAQLGLSRRSVEEQEISLPSLGEQTAIATILFDMDTELATLELRCDKARQIKQGMMEALLTGRIRIPQGERR